MCILDRVVQFLYALLQWWSGRWYTSRGQQETHLLQPSQCKGEHLQLRSLKVYHFLMSVHLNFWFLTVRLKLTFHRIRL